MDKEFRIKKIGKDDLLFFQKLIRLFHEVFVTDPVTEAGDAYLSRLLEKTGFIAYVIVLENEVIGGLTAYELAMYTAPSSEAFIYDLAIKPEFQRQGLGKKLLNALENYCRENAISLMFVEANEEDKHAVEFYRSAGGQPEKVVHFNYLIDK